MAGVTSEDKVVLEAATIFLLMKKGFPISRNVRAQWMLEHLDTVISVQQNAGKYKEAPELETVSVIPKNKPEEWSAETSHLFLYKITAATSIIFLSHKYKMVFNLDLSPSLATVDIQNGQIVIDEVYMATKVFLESVSKPFTIPGSKRVLHPEIYVTIIAHTPYFTSPAQQVLVQGWLITLENVNRLTQFLEKQLNLLEKKVASITAIANQELENLRAENERLVGGLFEESACLNKNNSNCIANTSMVSPESSFVNMLRYGMLALTLLPEHSCAHMIVVSDGIVGTTDIRILDSIMQQLRATTIACSFIHVGSSYHPHCADGLVPYQDLLYFLATATLGTYMSFTLHHTPVTEAGMNIYHKNFLCWQLHRDVVCECVPDHMNWQSKNSIFHQQNCTQLLRKKHFEDKVTCTLNSLLCCRLREGYLIKRANIRDDILEICFVLLWKSDVCLEYLVTCPWSLKSLSASNTIQYTITIDAPYEFLHDITCSSKKPLKSQYRQCVVSRFWAALTSLTESNNMLAHFSWFPGSDWTWYSVPDTIRSGMPVFYLSASPSPNTVQLRHAACPQFGQIWQPVVSLDAVQWARWMHTQRVTLILSHDRPLPRHLHQANQSGRFQCVQSRQAAAVLYAMLKNWATFVLVENHTYVQFIYREAEKPPVSFSLIRINCKALCVVLNIAFAGGTEGIVRHNVVIDLVDRLSNLTLPNRPTEQRETPSCIIIHKPLERILIRYERMPTDLSSIVFPDGTQPSFGKTTSIFGGTLTTTLSRYLYHNRWLWHVKRPFVQTIPGITLPRLNVASIARILSTITKMRLSEGFSFAYSAAGIINMVLEVQMQDVSNNNLLYPCIIQYILFPPHLVSNTVTERDSGSEEDTDEGTADGDCEGSGDFQIVTEVWIEPQCGTVQMPTHPSAAFMNSLQYHELPEAIAQIDEECINALLTLEHLSLLSQVVPAEKSTEIVYGQEHQDLKLLESNSGIIRCSSNTEDHLDGPPIIDERIHSMHFSFDTLSILPKCQQAELLFSMFADGSTFDDEGQGSANRILMDNFLEHMKQLHNKELLLTSAESQRFTELLLNRPREDGPSLPFFTHTERTLHGRDPHAYPRWKCFVKGISTTHVIITILPASEKDVRLFMYATCGDESCGSNNSEKNCETGVFNLDLNEKQSSPNSYSRNGNGVDCLVLENELKLCAQSNDGSTTKTDQHGNFTADTDGYLVIPVYVYDCSLALLIEALVDKLKVPRNKDIFQDHTFRIGQQECEDCVELKSECNTKPASPEPKSEDSDNIASDQRSLMEHCKLLSLAHCNCYVVAVYKSLVLQQPLSYEDMEAAVEQCEENVIEINITNYLRSVCRHLSKLPEGNLLNELKVSACNYVKPLHNLIRDKFERIMTVAFRPVPAHPEFYYCSPPWIADKMDPLESPKSDSDDELQDFTFHSEIIDYKYDSPCEKGNITWPATNPRNIPKLASHDSTEYSISELEEEHIYGREQPLFLQLSCSIHFRSGLNSIPVKLLPTCFTEIIQRMHDYKEDMSNLNPANLKITLDIICLNLPREVLEISLERNPGLRTTSFCSGSPLGSFRTESGSSPSNNPRNEPLQERMSHLPINQQNAINSLTSEIEWLLQDETATAFLDRFTVNEEILNFVATHVADSVDRTSCKMEKVPLQFVFPSEDSKPKFLKELKKLKIDRYCIKQEGRFFYFVKNVDIEQIYFTINDSSEVQDLQHVGDESIKSGEGEQQENNERINQPDIDEPPGCYSEISSIVGGKLGTEDGYEGDSSNSEDDFQWLIELDKRRKSLPNFWLILNLDNNHVNVYFHCRFLEITSSEVDRYWQAQKMLITQIKGICRRVNQYLLLQNLHDTRKCSELLETETNEDYTWKSDSLLELGHSLQHPSPVQNMTPGMFRCPVIWEHPFCLHPKLKTGPGRSGLSRGIKALHGVLTRFSVNNRSNMFVYQENNKNVFYLRLHEQTNDGKSLQNKLSESDEKLVVSRSNSVVSLSQAKTGDNILTTDTRPRVRSFGEKESDILNKSGDSIVLRVHGISDAGPEVKCDLVQVLQNRLDDAVLEVLSIMLSRNPMCKLSPADVHFIQKPFKPPECITRLRIPEHCLAYTVALGFYLRQNILQFLYTPKYTDSRAHYHFQDYSQPEGSPKRVPESNIFLYNQTHSSGNKGIACIALAITNEKGESVNSLEEHSSKPTFPRSIKVEEFEDLVSTSIFNKNTKETPPLIEFRIWKQGRGNLESLIQKLSSAVKHAIWDLVTEYNFLATPLTVPSNDSEEVNNESENMNQQEIDKFEGGEDGELHETYRVTLAQWFKFALEIRVPAVKKHEVILSHRHAIPVIVRDLQSLINSQATDTLCKVFVLQNKQPFIENYSTKLEKQTNSPVYIPFDYNKDDQGTYTKCILIARNFKQWKACFNKGSESEPVVPKDQKVLQRFSPLILDTGFVPRQWILLAEIQSDNITLYMYNWSKEKSEKLIKNTTGLGAWLSCRSSVYTNIIMQKLGIFHHRPNYTKEQTSCQYFQINDLESLAKFPCGPDNETKDWTRSSNRAQNAKNNPVSLNNLVGQVMRDAKPNNYNSHNTSDPVMKAVYAVHDLRQREKKAKEDLSKLHAMWQSRSTNIPISISALNTFKQHSRLIHFCHTPLLFLPSWRFQSAATRDHSLATQSIMNNLNTDNTHQQLPQQVNTKQESKEDVVKWHQELCDSMLSEYKQYLQILGFNPIQVDYSKSDEEETQQQSYYLWKLMQGGVLLFEIHLSQPFFIVKLHIIECSRLQTKNTSAMINQYVQTFVDACDKIKINMHLHSFTYDFHLRCIHSYIAGSGTWSLQQGYHLTHFLDDFNKYYTKAPNYARNLVYNDVITIRNLAIPARTLYSYLLSHEKSYGMNIFKMTGDQSELLENEYALVNLKSTPLISYCDAQDTRYTDDFDVALIVSRVEQPTPVEKTEITLKYYLMLTSKRELYPKREVENNKLGKFRTVYTIEKSITSSGADLSEPSIETSKTSSSETSSEFQESPDQTSLPKEDCKGLNNSVNNNCNNGAVTAPTPPPVPNSPLTQNANTSNAFGNSSPPLVQIRQESINYLGYYSSHEQLMQQMIMSQADAARKHILDMIKRGALECRTDLLWTKLLENKPSMNYTEFSELCSLAHVESLSSLDQRLNPFFNQPISWYQALSKVLQNKYQEHHKQFNASDGAVTHHLILPPSSLQAFMMLTIDLHTSRGNLYAVYRKTEEIINTPLVMEDIYTLIEGFVNACCFHLWVGLCSQ